MSIIIRKYYGFYKEIPVPENEDFLELIVGLEPTTYALRMRCSTN